MKGEHVPILRSEITSEQWLTDPSFLRSIYEDFHPHSPFTLLLEFITFLQPPIQVTVGLTLRPLKEISGITHLPENMPRPA